MSQPEPLTAWQLKALRNASSVTFHWDKDTKHVTVQATHEYDPNDGYGRRDLRVDFTILGRITTMRNPSPIPRATPIGAYWSAGYASVDQVWGTAIRSLRADDELTAHWQVGGNVPISMEGVIDTSFTLEVCRTGKTRKYMSFLLGYTIETPNCTLPAVSYGVTEYTLNTD